MGDRIVLRTACRDNGEAIGVLARDLESGNLVLPADHSVEVGAWVAFEVLLRDGQAFLEGMGKCVASDRAMNGHRVRLDDLQLDVAGELLFERIVMARDDLEHGGRQTGEIDIGRLAEATNVTAQAVAPQPPPPLPKPPPKPASALPTKPASALPPRPVVPPTLPRPASAVPVARPPSALPPRPVVPARPPTGTPPARPRPPSIIPTSPGGFPAVRPDAAKPDPAKPIAPRPASVRPPSEVRPASVRPPAIARSGLPPAPRVPTFAPTPFAPEDTRIDTYAGDLPKSDTTTDTTLAALRESRRPAALEAQLQRLLPRLVAEGRVRDAEELRALALRLGLEALEIVYAD